MSVLLQDVRFAARALAWTPGFTLLAVLTMALGIGVNTTIFSMANATLWHAPDGIGEPDLVVQIGRDRDEEGFDNLSFPHYWDLRESAQSLQSVAAFAGRSMVLGKSDAIEVVNGQLVTEDFFTVLGTKMAQGRDFAGTDATRAPEHVVVISDQLWTQRFGRSADTLGSNLRINGSDYQIVGIAEPGFRGTDVLHAASDVFVPLGLAGLVLGPDYAEFNEPGFSWLWVVARRFPDVAPEALRAELDAIYQSAYFDAWGERANHSLGVDFKVGIRPAERSAVAQILFLLQLVVVAVLVVACANLASMLLARGMSRSQELAVRSALGAGKLRIVRQVLTESVLIACAGGVVAALLTIWTTGAIPALLPMAVGYDFRPDLRVFAFAMALSVVAGVVFGLAPALRASRDDIVDTLKDGSPLAGRRAGFTRSGLVVGQLALSFALLAATGLLLRSTMQAQNADPGFNTANVMTVSLNLDRAGYDPVRGGLFLDELAQRAAALPGVDAAGIGSGVPFTGWSRRSVPWPTPRPQMSQPFTQVDTATVDASYFEALGMSILEGEGFAPANSGADMAPVVLLSRSAAELLWPGERAIDRLLALDPESDLSESLRVIGIVADVQNRSLRESPRPSMYVPRSQTYAGGSSLFVRAQGDVNTLSAPLRDLIADLDPELGIFSTGTLRERIGRSLADTVLMGRLVGISGALALALAAIGLYGTVSFVASSRSREVGIRMALGAQRSSVVGLFGGEAAKLALIGIGLGMLLMLATEGLLRSLLLNVSGRDPLTLGATALSLMLIGLLAAAGPTLRATRVDPAHALRDE